MRREDEERLALNEATFRRINEAIEAGRRQRGGLIGLLCECGRLGCNEVVELTFDEYEAVRAHARRFLIVDGHETAVDELLERRERYAVVAKREGPAADLVEALDPRGS